MALSYEQFLEWTDEDTSAEWEDGRVIIRPSETNIHQDLLGFLLSILGIYVEERRVGVVRQIPFQMKLAHSGREPDIMVISNVHQNRLRTFYLDGPADLVVEIISQESIKRDRGTKFVEYEAAAIPEYWLIDPLRNWAEFYQLDDKGCYTPTFAGRQGTYDSPMLPGFSLCVDWLWQMPLPPVLDVLHELKVL